MCHKYILYLKEWNAEHHTYYACMFHSFFLFFVLLSGVH